jgi:hypothetical protein
MVPTGRAAWLPNEPDSQRIGWPLRLEFYTFIVDLDGFLKIGSDKPFTAPI